MSEPVRIPNRYKKEIYKIQIKYRLVGVNLSFSQAFEMWVKKLKGFDKISRKKWKFPEF